MQKQHKTTKGHRRTKSFSQPTPQQTKSNALACAGDQEISIAKLVKQSEIIQEYKVQIIQNLELDKSLPKQLFIAQIDCQPKIIQETHKYQQFIKEKIHKIKMPIKHRLQFSRNSFIRNFSILNRGQIFSSNLQTFFQGHHHALTLH